jgi:very-short-patch-repair endonuclease
MVDVPAADVLPLQERTTFKQRYNVAASRARDQLWLVHCLDPRRDLQPSDLRRRLIEHIRAPGARREPPAGARRPPSLLEQEVRQRLLALGFRVEVQVSVGGYPLDMVVSHDKSQVAVECDGDRVTAIDRLPEELAKQAVLERVGWRFVRVRATRFYRDPDGTIDQVVAELQRLGVAPMTEAGDAAAGRPGENLESKIVRRAWQIMRAQEWVTEGPAIPPPLPARRDAEATLITTRDAVPASTVAELVLDDTTEPHFVILEQSEDPDEAGEVTQETQETTEETTEETTQRTTLEGG